MRKPFVKFAQIAAVSLCAVSLLSGARPASPKAGDNAKSDILQGNASCGFSGAGNAIGFTNYHRNGNTVSFEYHLKGARPNTDYTVELWGDFCSFFATTGVIHTNSNGVANGNFSVDVNAASTRFFATAFNNADGFNDTEAVTLLP